MFQIKYQKSMVKLQIEEKILSQKMEITILTSHRKKYFLIFFQLFNILKEPTY